MLFSWWQNRRRRKILSQEFPREWYAYLERNVLLYDTLYDEEQAKLRDDLRIFIAEKYWEGCGGLEMTDEVRVTIAAQACLLILNKPHQFYRRLRSILVYPDTFISIKPDVMLGRTKDVGAREGESWVDGPVILNWAEIVQNAQHINGHNLVLHEFAHQLDMYDRVIDGTPRLDDTAQYRSWHLVMTQEYQQLVDDAQHGRPTLLDKYGTTDEAEFFAVCTECFFERPRALQSEHERLYQLLSDYYQQDPAERTYSV